ncbi:MAG TPA: ABC transporter substrate-binding protein [Candidatus Cybelea sp.]|nr:ABC transporter substrate-binding protein [Candidatus Cybelea sp.]
MVRYMQSAAARASLAAALAFLVAGGAAAQKKYDPGATDTEIKIGQTMPYSGGASAYGTIGRSEAAYFKLINEQGGVNGRKINLISLDDGLSPPKTVEQTRRLVEQDNVLFMFQMLGTPTSIAARKYLNAAKVPQLFVASGATAWTDYEHYPWTIGWQPNYQTEAHVYARYILEHKPDAKIAILYQNDDFGKDYIKGLRDVFGDKADKLIVATVSYEANDPTVESQVVTLAGSGATVWFNGATPKYAAQSIRKAYDIGWKPLQFLTSVSESVGAVLQPAGLEKAVGIISIGYLKDPTDPQWQNEQGFKDWAAWMKKYYPEGNTADIYNVWGYSAATTLIYVLKQCGDNLTRENVMHEATNIKELKLPLLLPGITLGTSPTHYAPISSLQLQRFDGKNWVLFGDVIGG